MLRPVRQPSEKNNERIDEEWMKEQRILEAKREKYNEIEDSRRKEIFADQDQKVENQTMRFREMQQQLRQKDEISRVEKLEELKHAEIIELQTKLSEAVERDQQERQAEYQRHLMDENKNLMDYRDEIAKKKKELELLEDKARPDYFRVWNRSAR